MCNVHFILTLIPPWLQVKVTKYFDFGNLDVWRVAVCVHFSSETTRPISPMMIPINWENSVDVQRALHFDLDPSMTAGQGQGHDIIWFWEFSWVVVCVRFSSKTTQPISPMLMPIYQVKNVDLQQIHHFDLHPSMTAGQGHKYFNFVNLGCCLGINGDICRGHIRSRAIDLI